MKSQAWHQNRLDLAEHLFSQISTASFSAHARSAEMFAEILLEIGSGLLDDMRSDSSVHWLERLYTVIEQQGLVAVSANMGELRLNVMHTYGKQATLDLAKLMKNLFGNLVQALLSAGQSTASTKAKEVMSALHKVLMRCCARNLRLIYARITDINSL